MAALNRQYFTVIIFPGASSGGNSYLNPNIIKSVDEVSFISTHTQGEEVIHYRFLTTSMEFTCWSLYFMQVLEKAKLDILVFADQLSEPQSFLYNIGRWAAVQVTQTLLSYSCRACCILDRLTGRLLGQPNHIWAHRLC